MPPRQERDAAAHGEEVESNPEERGQKQIKPLRVLGHERHSLKHGALNINKIELVAPTGFDSQASLFELSFEGLALAR